MDTPPQNNNRYNPEVIEELRHDFQTRGNVKAAKFAQCNPSSKQNVEKDNLQKMLAELRGQLKYIDETNWMFDNLNNNDNY